MGHSVVIIEDNHLHRKLYSEIISVAGFSPVPVEDERHAIEIVANTMPRTIIVDIRLPHIDGRKIIVAMRQDDRISSIPILAVSAFAEHDLEKSCMEAGADFFRKKPVPVPSLIKLIMQLAR